MVSQGHIGKICFIIGLKTWFKNSSGGYILPSSL